MSKKILIVDDSKTMRDMVSYTLKGAGFDVTEAADGVLAMQEVGDKQFDVVVTDLNMPNLDGFGLIEQLRANARYKYTPILMLTTESDTQKKERGKAAGATGWIVKPFNPEKLVQVVSKVCA